MEVGLGCAAICQRLSGLPGGARMVAGRGGWTASGWPTVPGALPPTLPWADAPCFPGQTPNQAWGCQLSNDCTRNPAFCTFNMVYLKTCDGGSWSGNRSDESGVALRPGATPLYYRGRAILDATASALGKLGITNATEIVIGGGSAGALGVYLQLDHWNRTLNPNQDKRVVGLPDCGFFQDWDNNSYHQGFVWMQSAAGMNSVVDPVCRAAHPTQPNLCLMAEHLSPYITTPLFALQAKFDSYQIPHICGADCTTTVQKQAYGDALVAKLHATVLNRKGNGAMVDACYHHCAGYNTYTVAGLTQAEAVQIWYERGAAALPENGRLFSNATYPCAACCNPPPARPLRDHATLA